MTPTLEDIFLKMVLRQTAMEKSGCRGWYELFRCPARDVVASGLTLGSLRPLNTAHVLAQALIERGETMAWAIIHAQEDRLAFTALDDLIKARLLLGDDEGVNAYQSGRSAS